ncbi:MAG: glycosyltransferase family 4 protein [Pseudomonadota bacterium]
MTRQDPSKVEVIAPNLKHRLSGVTATVYALVPIQAKEIEIAALGLALPPGIPQIRLRDLPALPRGRPIVWHARRNIEMIAGLALRVFLGGRLKLLFTSASQRHHTRLTRALIARMDWVIAVSDKSAEYLSVPHQVVRHGIDTRRFHPARDRAALRRRLRLEENAVIVGCFGRIRAQKGTGDFVDAMLQLMQTRKDVHAIAMGGVVGHEDYVRELKTRITRAGLGERLRIMPEVPVDNMPDWYAALDLYVAPQRWEGFGLTVLEAMSSGVPVVATGVGAFEELLDKGRMGTLVEPGDVPSLAAAIAPILDDPQNRLRLGAEARSYVEARFAIEGEAQALVDVYRKLLAKP